MRVLITGNRGFVGSETQKLIESFKKPNLHFKPGAWAGTTETLPEHFVIGYDLMDGFDIRDKEQLERIIEEVQPDRILHLAAIARFSDADKDPNLAFETNVLGTKNVVDVAMKYHIPLVFSSTGSAIMPLDSYTPPFDETIPARGNSVYGSSKAVAETYVTRHVPHIVLRYGHLFGPDKKFHGLIGGFLSRIERGMAPTLYGGLQTNSFVYIKDVARANYLALTAPYSSWNQTYNVGSPEEISAEDAGNMICEVFDYSGGIEKAEQRTVDPSRFAMSTKKAETMLGFKCEFSFMEGLRDMKEAMAHAKPL